MIIYHRYVSVLKHPKLCFRTVGCQLPCILSQRI